MIRGPYSTEPARLEVILLAMQGVGKPGVHQFKIESWGVRGDLNETPMPRPLFMLIYIQLTEDG